MAMTKIDLEYLQDPKTAVIEGLGSAIGDIASDREMADLPDLNLTTDEIKHIEEKVTEYILMRFSLTWKP